MLITATNINKYFGEEQVLRDIKMTIDEKKHYGLIGIKGAGKSTLLKIITEDMTFEEGELVKKPSLTIGYLAQNNGLERDCSIIAEMRKVFDDVLSAEDDMRRLELEMAALEDHNSAEYRQISAKYAQK